MLTVPSSIQRLPLLLFEILLDCSEFFLDFLENLVCDFLNFFNKYFIVRKKILPFKYNKISSIPVYRVFLKRLTQFLFCSLALPVYHVFYYVDTVLFQTDLSIVTQFCSSFQTDLSTVIQFCSSFQTDLSTVTQFGSPY